MFPPPILDLATKVLAQARAAKLHIVTAESCTGGLIAGALTEIAGSSDVFERGFVTYSNEAKIALLGVSPELIAQFGAVSQAVALAMAEGALKNSRAELAVSCTGIAGPSGGTPAKPVGLVYIAVSHRMGSEAAVECRLGNIGRSEVRMKSVEAALHQLLAVL